MDKRTIIALIICFLIFIIAQQVIWKKPQPTAPAATEQTAPAPQETQPLQTKEKEITPVIPISLPQKDMPPAVNDLILENDSLKLVFTNKGANIREVYLKKFKMADNSMVQLIPPGEELTNVELQTLQGLLNLNEQPFLYEYIEENGRKGIRFYLPPNSTQEMEKKFLLGSDYGVRLTIRLYGGVPSTGYNLDFASGIRDTEAYLKAKATDYRFYSRVNNTLIQKDLGKLNKGAVLLSGKIDWAAIRSKYFVMACLDIPPVLSSDVKADTTKGSPAFRLTVRSDKTNLDWDEQFTLYFGPSQFELLRKHGSGLENIAERGWRWLQWLVDIFAWFLSFLYRLIPNYGIVIIVFSLVLKVILHPLTHKSMDASLKMQRIQPQVQEIQQKFKSDPKRMQQELSKLYKEAGASPLGGCLPLILQMPVFFSLYTVLRYSLDMRMAHFVGWLRDLSEPDPYYILPILMGVFMVVQQLMMNPKKQQLSSMDEKQRAMMQSQKMMAYVMPVVLFFVFKSMPAGLVLYWTVFNVLSIIQQYYLQKHLSNKETA